MYNIAFHQLCTTSTLEAESYLIRVPLSLSLLSTLFLVSSYFSHTTEITKINFTILWQLQGELPV